MSQPPKYYTLVASLPHLPPLFAANKPPVSRERLQNRIDMLLEEDRRELTTIQDLMHWDRLPLDFCDREIVEKADRVIPNLRSDRLKQVATWRMEIRTVVAGLRRRAAGGAAPVAAEQWGYGRWTWHIERNWNRPDFGLGTAVPYVVPFQQLIEQKDALGLERALLNTVYTELNRVADLHYFDFESVALYVLRWDIIARWTGQDQDRAQERFDGLVQEGIGEYADLFSSNERSSR